MFLKNVLTLLTGTVVAQALPLLAAPILSRIYSPEEFGTYGVFIALLAIFTVASSLRYDFATAQADTNVDARNLYSLSTTISLIFTLVFLLISLANLKFNFFDEYLDSNNFLLVSLGGFLLCNIQLTTYYLNRRDKFKITSFLKVAQSIVAVVVMIATSYFERYFNGLVLGHIVGQLVFLTALFYILKSEGIASYRELKYVLIKYKSYPINGAPGAIFNTAFLQLPLFYIKASFDAVFAGYYTVINRYLAGPLSLISISLSQVLMKEMISKDYKSLYFMCQRVVLVNILISIVFYLFFIAFGEFLVVVILGDAWVDMHKYLLVLLISVCIRFAVSPLSVILTKQYNIHLALQWQFFSFIALLFFLLFSNYQNIGFYDFLIFYVSLDVILYLLYFIQIKRGVKLIELNDN